MTSVNKTSQNIDLFSRFFAGKHDKEIDQIYPEEGTPDLRNFDIAIHPQNNNTGIG
jgi:hypothetical protein